MIKTILFDFDGVILDSMKIKGDGFLELVKEYPQDKLQILEAYHYANGGISRFDKIRYFFHTILQTPITEEKVNQLATKFGEIIEKKLFDTTNLIPETMSWIEKNYKIYDCHIVSGAEHNELKSLCTQFNIDHYFKSINGSPTKKSVLIFNLLKTNHYQPQETILIGDSSNDYDAAQVNGIHFYGYNNPELISYGNYITSFKNFLP